MGRTSYTFKKKAATTATGNSGWIRLPAGYAFLQLTEDCDNATAGSSPTMDVLVETNTVGSDTGKRTCHMTAFTQVTGSGGGKQRRRIGDLDGFVKITWTIGGTASPSFPLGISGSIDSFSNS